SGRAARTMQGWRANQRAKRRWQGFGILSHKLPTWLMRGLRPDNTLPSRQLFWFCLEDGSLAAPFAKPTFPKDSPPADAGNFRGSATSLPWREPQNSQIGARSCDRKHLREKELSRRGPVPDSQPEFWRSNQGPSCSGHKNPNGTFVGCLASSVSPSLDPF